MDLKLILENFHNQERRRATGGLVALAGFDFQLRAYLADFVAALVDRSPGLESAGNELAHRLESLSDYTTTRAGETVVVQAKRTLNTTVLRQAATEFVRLDAFLEEESRAGRSFEPCFELVANGGKPLTWDDFSGFGSDTPENVERSRRFERLRSTGRLCGPRIEVDPWWRLVAKLYPHVADPVGFAQEALDACLGVGLEAGGPSKVHLQIAGRLAEKRRTKPLLTEFLTPAQVAPDPKTKEVVVGQIPTLFHLRDGRFLDRPELVKAALLALEGKTADLAPDFQESILLFWIDGRSGSGKSVLLLQLLRELVTARGSPVIWLDNNVDQLVPLLERWSLFAGGLDFPAFIAIDDLFDRQGREKLELQKLASLVRSAPGTRWPILLSCGPPEFFDALQRESRGEGLQLVPWRLPPLTAVEAEAVRVWFEQRTLPKKQSKEAPESGPKQPKDWKTEPLMVSLLFELSHGTLESFAGRFAARLKTMGLEEALRLPLALNRLYLLAPHNWLSAEEVDRLDALNQDSDFSILDSQVVAGAYLKLTHPHLSDDLYRAVRPFPSDKAYSRDLASAFEKALSTAPQLAWRILHVLGEGSERLEIFHPAELASGIVKAWRAGNAEEKILALAPQVWTDWARWAARSPTVKSALGFDPLEKAKAALSDQQEVPSWGFLWLALWEAAPTRTDLRSLATGWVCTEPRFSRPEWSIVWQKLFEDQKDPDVKTGLAQAGWKWLQAHQRQKDWNFVWQVLAKNNAELPAGVTPAALAKLGVQWVKTSSTLSGWAHVWQRLLELPAVRDDQDEFRALMELGKAWLSGREERSEWTHVWERLLELPAVRDDLVAYRALIARGEDWLSGREDRSEWTHVWRRLLKLLAVRDDQAESRALMALGKNWLSGREDRSEWTHVWRRLLELPAVRKGRNESRALVELGKDWLSGREDRREWAHVWQRLLKLPMSFDDQNAFRAMVALGRDWLSGREERSEWAHVWQRLLELRVVRDDQAESHALMDLGKAWLSGHEARSEWPYVWLRLLDRPGLYDDRTEIRNLIAVGKNWLAGREQHRQSPRVSAHLRKLSALEGFEALHVGQVFRGVVTEITGFGVFVDIGSITGLLHRSAMGAEGAPWTLFRKGQELEVVILSLDLGKRHFALGLQRG